MLQAVHAATLKGSAMQLGAVTAFAEAMRAKLTNKPWIADHSTSTKVICSTVSTCGCQSSLISPWRAGDSHLDLGISRHWSRIMYARLTLHSAQD